MTEQRRTALKELQKLDIRIQDAQKRIHDFDPLFEEVEEPALILEGELGTSRNRVKEMKLEERRLELSIEERRQRAKKLDERLAGVRNLREEAAVSAELEMVRRALQNDEQEALSLIDLVRKGEERLAELESAFAEATELVEPKRKELLQQREDAKKELSGLEDERAGFAAQMNPSELKIYDAIRGNGARAAVAELTEDGACGNCYGMVPLQHQNEVRHGDTLIRCEACGVIIAAAEPVVEGAEEAPVVDAVEAGTDGAAAVDANSDDSDASSDDASSDDDAADGSDDSSDNASNEDDAAGDDETAGAEADEDPEEE